MKDFTIPLKSSSIDGRGSIFDHFNPTEDMQLVVIKDDLGGYRSAEETCNQIIHHWNPKTDQQIQMFYKEKLASLLRDRGDHERARDLGIEAIDSRSKDYIYDTDALFNSVGELCLNLRCLGRESEAYRRIRQCYESFEVKPFDTMRSTRTMSVYSRLCGDCGEYKLSGLLARDVLSASRHHLGDGHHYISVHKSYLAISLALTGNLLTGKKCSQQAMRSIVRGQGKLHPNAFLAGAILGDVTLFNSEPEDAYETLSESILGLQKEGRSHAARTLRTRGYIAAAEALCGYTGTSEQTLQQIEDEQKKILPKSHCDLDWTSKVLSHIRLLLDDRSIDHTKWRHNPSKICREAREFLTSPKRPPRTVDWKTREQAWPDSKMDEMITFLAPGREKELEQSVQACKDPAKLGAVLRLAAACCPSDNMEAVRIIVRKGKKFLDIDSKGGFYGTALQAACAARSKPLAEFLIENNADINATGGLFGSAIRAAVFYGEKDIVELLLRNDADINSQDKKSMTILQIAIAFGHRDITHLLLSKAPHHAKLTDELYGSPLQEACAKGYRDIVQALLDNGAVQESDEKNDSVYGTSILAARANDHEDIALKLETLKTPPTSTLDETPASSPNESQAKDSIPSSSGTSKPQAIPPSRRPKPYLKTKGNNFKGRLRRFYNGLWHRGG